jgi:hypothetical protein
MKFQFGIKTILLATTVVAISCSAMIAFTKAVGYGSFGWVYQVVLLTSVGWLPFAFAAFAIGRRALTARMVVAFASAETSAVGLAFVLTKCF